MEILIPHQSSDLMGNVTADLQFKSAQELIIEFNWNKTWPLKNASVNGHRHGFSREDNIWKSTCFEAFINPENSDRYWEINVSPLHKWNFYEFSGYRTPQPPREAGNFQLLAIKVGDGSLWASFSCDFEKFRKFNVALTCILESKDGILSYWAKKHVLASPDFHHASTLVLKREIE